MAIAEYIKNSLPYWPNVITIPLLKINFFKGLCYGFSYLYYGRKVTKSTPEQKLVAIANYAIQNVPYYRKRYSNLKIKSLEDFQNKIGYIDKEEVLRNWNDFIADKACLDKCNKGMTGGTSGKPMKLITPKNRYVHSMYFWHKKLKRYGWNYDPVAVIRNTHIPKGRKYIVNPIMRHVIFDGFNTSDDYFREVWRSIRKLGIKYIYAYPSSAYAFFKSCKRQHLDISFFRACFLTSEAITDNARFFFEKETKIPIMLHYGHSEKLCEAATYPGMPYYLIEENYGFTELINEKGQIINQSGFMGEITGSTFFNKYFVLLRYRTGDYASYVDNVEKSSPRFLDHIEGRWNQSQIYLIDNTTISTTALNLHADIYERIDGLQYIQEKRGYLIVRIIPNKLFTEEDYNFFKQFYAKAMKGEAYVEIELTNNLVFQPNGKFLPLISKV